MLRSQGLPNKQTKAAKHVHMLSGHHGDCAVLLLPLKLASLILV